MVEIVCASVDDCIEAERGGAGRIELVAALEVGGLTPSIGTVREAVRHASIPILVMIRPRSGGFHYSPTDFAAMRADTIDVLEAGAAGIVFGCLRADGQVDAERTRELVSLADGRDTVVHSAFDVTPDPVAALETLIGCGVSRILVCGRKPKAADGIALIRSLHEQAAGRIGLVLRGGDVCAENARSLLDATGLSEVHFAPFTSREDLSCAANTDLKFGGLTPPKEGEYALTDQSAVARAVQSLK